MWIETKDRLPEHCKAVFIAWRFRGDLEIDLGYFLGPDMGWGRRRNVWYWHDSDEEVSPITVIAWFDLPKYVPSADQLIEELGY